MIAHTRFDSVFELHFNFLFVLHFRLDIVLLLLLLLSMPVFPVFGIIGTNLLQVRMPFQRQSTDG